MGDTVTAPPPVVEGWFARGPDPHLIGQRCAACATVVFPPRALTCPSPRCTGEQLDAVALSTHGTVWSYATNHYPPPPPYVPDDPFTPVTVAAVELAAERLVVLGTLAGPTDGLRVGAPVELTVGTLRSADGSARAVWQWQLRDVTDVTDVADPGGER